MHQCLQSTAANRQCSFFIGELLVWNGAGFICLAMWQVKGVSSTFDAVKAISDIRVLVSTDVVLVLPWSCEIESWLACTISYEYRFCNTNSILFRHSSVGYEQYATLSSKAYLTSCITRGSQFVRCSLQEFKASREIAGDLCPIYKLAFLPRKGGEEKEAIHPIKRCQIGRTERLRILIPPVPSQAGRGRLPSPLLERRLSTTFGHFSPPATINVRRNPNLQCWAGQAQNFIDAELDLYLLQISMVKVKFGCLYWTESFSVVKSAKRRSIKGFPSRLHATCRLEKMIRNSCPRFEF